MKRREFIALAGSAITWPLAAGAQQPDRLRRLGILAAGADDSSGQSLIAAFVDALQQLGWTDGRNLRIDYRRGLGDVANMRVYAAELVALAPDILLVFGTAAMAPMLQATRTIPIVFANVADPVGAGFVDNLARPGGNATGFMQFEYSLAGKWPELLREIAPGVKRAAVLRDAALSSGIGQFAVIQAVAPSLGIEVSPINVLDAGEIERSVAAFARFPNGGLILTASGLSSMHRDLITGLAAQHRLPATYPFPYIATVGGLIAYGPDLIDQYRRAADYVDRILKGTKPADLPVQVPTRYELTINLKTARDLGLAVPPTLLARADKVIE
ncbi:MAG TPA: ABC transporter substrate-binding protein [Bradyrhizobium sp.]|jgi:putative ABC transport system substrate-binding protein